MNTHETLPFYVRNYIKDESISIDYIDLQNILGFLYNKNIFINTNKDFYKKRFSICHELGHYFYGDKFSFPDFGYSFYEKRADNFAMQILLPAEELIKTAKEYNWDLTVLEKLFGIERQIIEKRIKQILKIKHGESSILW